MKPSCQSGDHQSTHGLIGRATTRADRWVIVSTALSIIYAAVYFSMRPVGEQVVVYRDNRPVLTLSLSYDRSYEVDGALGPVTIQVEGARVRLLEYNSPRMIGMRRGWIHAVGAITACVPCGIVVRVTGTQSARAETEMFDGIAY